jgi:integrase
MPKTLSASQVKSLTEVGVYRVDHNLYVQIKPNGARSWVCRYQVNGRRREMGLGPIRLVDLSKARIAANDAKKLALSKVDPLDQRRAERKPIAKIKVPSFEQCAADYIASQKDGWRNAKHAYQWGRSLGTYAFPTIGKLPVDQITVDLVHQLLKPIWSTKSDTASRVRGRIERVLGWAEAKKYRQGQNPASWQGPLGHLLPPLSKVQTVEHHEAVPYAEAPALYRKIRGSESDSAKALGFVMLNAVRPTEGREVRWGELDIAAKVWVIPAGRMKANVEHRVPLSDEAIALLPATRGADDGFVFPGERKGRPFSDRTLIQLLRKLRSEDESTVHGLRSTFRDWTAEQTDSANEVAEACLAHATGDAVQLAYKRTDFFDKRRELMAAWAGYLTA